MTDLPDEVCYGEIYQINCSHPPLGGSSGYLAGVFWRRNGVDYTTTPMIVNDTVTGIIVNVITSSNVTYSCYIVSRTEEESNNITVYPLSKCVYTCMFA